MHLLFRVSWNSFSATLKAVLVLCGGCASSCAMLWPDGNHLLTFGPPSDPISTLSFDPLPSHICGCRDPATQCRAHCASTQKLGLLGCIRSAHEVREPVEPNATPRLVVMQPCGGQFYP